MIFVAVLSFTYWLIIHYVDNSWRVEDNTRGVVYLIAAIVIIVSDKPWTWQKLGVFTTFIGVALRNIRFLHHFAGDDAVSACLTAGIQLIIFGLLTWAMTFVSNVMRKKKYSK
jgi:hypothetical protein